MNRPQIKKMSYTKPEGYITGEYYHIYNRGVEKRTTFLDDIDYRRFLKSLEEFNTSDPAWKVDYYKEKHGISAKTNPFVEILAFCLNPNHFHLLLKQLQDKGISEFMRKLGTGYTMYFNKRRKHSGVLFQGKFKSVHVDSNDQLLYVSAYINCNSEIHAVAKAEKYRWCSFQEYFSAENLLCKKDIILDQFHSSKEYIDFAKSNAKAIVEKREMEKLAIE
jgi:putative transposase